VKSRVILFVGGGFQKFGLGEPGGSELSSESAGLSPVRFFVPESKTFELEKGTSTSAQLAQIFKGTRHDKFDYAVGDLGAKCVLIELDEKECEWAAGGKGDATSSAATLGQGNFLMKGQWLSFPFATRALAQGECRRYLQLAVQYISSAGIEDNVVAANTDAGFLKTLEEKMKVAP
jgi:hypothetical protein